MVHFADTVMGTRNRHEVKSTSFIRSLCYAQFAMLFSSDAHRNTLSTYSVSCSFSATASHMRKHTLSGFQPEVSKRSSW